MIEVTLKASMLVCVCVGAYTEPLPCLFITKLRRLVQVYQHHYLRESPSSISQKIKKFQEIKSDKDLMLDHHTLLAVFVFSCVIHSTDPE